MNMDVEYRIKTKHFQDKNKEIDEIITDFFRKYSNNKIILDTLTINKVMGRVYEIKDIQGDINTLKEELKDLEDSLKSRYDDIKININYSQYKEDE